MIIHHSNLDRKLIPGVQCNLQRSAGHYRCLAIFLQCQDQIFQSRHVRTFWQSASPCWSFRRIHPHLWESWEHRGLQPVHKATQRERRMSKYSKSKEILSLVPSNIKIFNECQMTSTSNATFEHYAWLHLQHLQPFKACVPMANGKPAPMTPKLPLVMKVRGLNSPDETHESF